MTKQAIVKDTTIIGRIQFKSDVKKIIYLMRSSNGVDQYETFLNAGRACSCTCPSRKPCKHMREAEKAEQAMKPAEPATVRQPSKREESLISSARGQGFSLMR